MLFSISQPKASLWLRIGAKAEMLGLSRSIYCLAIDILSVTKMRVAKDFGELLTLSDKDILPYHCVISARWSII